MKATTTRERSAKFCFIEFYSLLTKRKETISRSKNVIFIAIIDDYHEASVISATSLRTLGNLRFLDRRYFVRFSRVLWMFLYFVEIGGFVRRRRRRRRRRRVAKIYFKPFDWSLIAVCMVTASSKLNKFYFLALSTMASNACMHALLTYI